jgi:hypothetical protein
VIGLLSLWGQVKTPALRLPVNFMNETPFSFFKGITRTNFWPQW